MLLALCTVLLIALVQSADAASSPAQLRFQQHISSVPSAGPYLAVAKHVSGEIASHIGHPLGLALSVVVNSSQQEGAKTLAYAAVEDSAGEGAGPPAKCVLHINPLSYKSKNTADFNLTMAHEVFHCFEAMDFPTVEAFGTAPQWLIEGEAEWVGATLDPATDPYWTKYLTMIKSPLFTRSYDAIGFYAHMTDSGEDTWHLLDKMLRAGSSAAAYDVAADKAVRLTWASSLAQETSFGEGWSTTGPGITSDKYQPTVSDVGDGTVLKAHVAPYANALIAFDPSSAVVTISTSTAYSRMHQADGTTIDGSTSISKQYCVHDCGQCPTMKDMPRLSPGETWLAVTGDSSGATYTVTGSPAVCSCIFGSWTVTSESGPFTGGAGVMWTIKPNGDIVVDYNSSAPVVGPGGGSYTYRGVADYSTTIPPNPKGSSGSYVATPTSQDITATYTIPGVGTKTTPVTAITHKTMWRCEADSLTLDVSAAGQTLHYALTRNGH